MRGSETVQVIPQAKGDRLRGTTEPAAPPYNLEGCHVLPRASMEAGGGVVGIEGFDVFYFGSKAEPPHTAKVVVRGETHEIDDVPRDFIVRGRRKVLIFATKKVGVGG